MYNKITKSVLRTVELSIIEVGDYMLYGHMIINALFFLYFLLHVYFTNNNDCHGATAKIVTLRHANDEKKYNKAIKKSRAWKYHQKITGDQLVNIAKATFFFTWSYLLLCLVIINILRENWQILIIPLKLVVKPLSFTEIWACYCNSPNSNKFINFT